MVSTQLLYTKTITGFLFTVIFDEITISRLIQVLF